MLKSVEDQERNEPKDYRSFKQFLRARLFENEKASIPEIGRAHV